MNHGNKLLIINVTGAASVSRKAERGTISVRVSSESESQSEVAQNVTSTSNQLQETFRTLTLIDMKSDTGSNSPIMKWTMGSLSTSSYIPWSGDDEQTPAMKYTANTSFEIVFRDFKELGSVATSLLEKPFVTVENVSWDLTNASKAELGTETRKGAFSDAVARAKDYAQAAGCSRTYPTEISDGKGPPTEHPVRLAAMMRSGGGGGDELSFTPEDVNVESVVHVKFEAYEPRRNS